MQHTEGLEMEYRVGWRNPEPYDAQTYHSHALESESAAKEYSEGVLNFGTKWIESREVIVGPWSARSN